MISLPQRETKLMVSVHGWSAVVLGFLLYAVVLTGTVAVLAKEIGQWSIGDLYGKYPLEHSTNEIVQKLSKKVGRAYRDDVGVGITASGHLQVFFHKGVRTAGGLNRERGVMFRVDPSTGEILTRQEGFAIDLRNSDEDTMLKRFIVDAHVQLYMPRPWGLIVTGILGLAMMAAGVSGFLMHRHLLRDIFTLRKRETQVLTARDKHTVAASWGLPFAFLLAFTGCFFSFVLSIGIPALAMVAFGGNQTQMVRTIMGTQFERPGKRIKTADLDAMIADATQRAGSRPRSIGIEHFGRRNAKVTIRHLPKFGQLEGKQYLYRGVDGTFVKEKPPVGRVPSTGSMLLTIIGPLHFGSFAGLLSKAIWVALGFSSCYVIVSGLTLWLRRRLDSPAWAWYERFHHVVALGLPISLAASAVAFFLFRGSPAVLAATPLSFVACAVALCMVALFVPGGRLEKLLWWLLSATLVLLPIIRILAGGPGWMTALESGAEIVVAVDLLLVSAGLACAWRVSEWLPVRSAKTAAA